MSGNSYVFALLISLLCLSAHTKAQENEFIFPDQTGEELVLTLQYNYSVSSSLSYSTARNFMFEDFDVVQGEVRGVYSGYTFAYSGNPNRIEAQDNGFNTEHTWPQSFFDQALPMRSDIHHLFITREDVNGARSNFKFDEINDNLTSRWYRLDQNQSTIPSSNIDEYSELLSNSSFEPREDFKGNIARAIFYFWTIYQTHPDIVNDGTDNEAFFESMKDVLLDWHLQDEVDEAEIQRSLNIESVQGNRNPFIHDTTLVRRAYFGAGVITSREEESEKARDYFVKQNYPNPFNPATTIEFGLESARNVRITVYNTNGQIVAELTNQKYAAGSHQITFNAEDLSSGMYVYSVRIGDAVENRTMTLIK